MWYAWAGEQDGTEARWEDCDQPTLADHAATAATPPCYKMSVRAILRVTLLRWISGYTPRIVVPLLDTP